MSDATQDPSDVAVTRIYLRGMPHAMWVAEPVSEVVQWMHTGGVYLTRSVYWQDENSASFDPEVRIYGEDAAAVRGELIVQAEDIGPKARKTIARARAAQAQEG